MLTGLIEWYNNEFKQTALYKDMEQTCEDSPWHREKTVAIHTDMVFQNYLNIAKNDQMAIVGGLAAIFHDVGKPAAAAINGIKYKPDRGHYKSFGGHELISARLWEDYAVHNWERLSQLGLNPMDIYRIGWIIEYHLPWGVKKIDKRRNIALTVKTLGIKETFIQHLMSDTYGRISDNAGEKIRKSLNWVNEFCEFVDNQHMEDKQNDDQPILWMPISASGSGKSTYSNSVDVESFSLDDLRTEFYGNDYRVAFDRSCADKDFGKKANARFLEMIKSEKDIFVDNTNTSKKRRAFYISEAKKHGYNVIALLFPITLDEAIARQETREDKTVPAEAVRRQYMGLQLPSLGEFHDVVVIPSNFLEEEKIG